MKVISDEKDNNTILLNDITEDHLVVAISRSNEPLLLVKRFVGQKSWFFGIIGNPVGSIITKGNGYSFDNLVSKDFRAMIRKANSVPGWSVEVFHKEDWKLALQWLIDNSN